MQPCALGWRQNLHKGLVTASREAGVTLPQPACRQPVAKLGGRLAGANVEEHRGRDEADDLAAKRAAKNTLRAKLVHE